ncbi:HNH endonuclease signature motif containing protein [Candidatus Mycolicibacterium alkanivorans]|uniref:HNH endonuclease n=1 Tax=Candidatus Mycolicibacterium alkanivorans TaxID=2954114 RepID=A0ABS9YWC1_9MYCO|nr:HNH endonuclease signature motif containing protein [Candidatus Mycolicibacterium alkanivorans]MCI4675511.1 HNH endonuclease [Candidatus Mycolicibacterium alkanivorans]
MLSNEVVGAFAAINAALDTVAEVDLRALAAQDLLQLAALTEKAIRRHTVVSHDLSQHLHQHSVAEIGGAAGKVLADWLRISPAEARRRARITEPLTERTTLTGESLAPRQPAAAEAWRAGVLDPEHLKVIQRFLGDLPLDVPQVEREKAEAFLAEQARLLRPDQLARVADRLAIELNPDGKFSDDDRARKRSFTLGRQHPDGMTEARLVATPELRSYLEALLAKFAAPGMCNPADQTAVTAGEPAAAQAEADTRTLGQRQHDALMAMLRSKLGDPKLGQHNGLPVTVIVTATMQELQDKTGYAVTGGGGLVPMRDVIRMASHAYHYLALFDSVTGQALWLGRSKRLATPDQRIVLHARDRGCTAPGCTVPGYGCQVHHAAKDWKDGGNTNVDELGFACKCDNLLVENGGWLTRKLPNGDTQWIPPPQLPLTGGVNTYHHPERFLREREGPKRRK